MTLEEMKSIDPRTVDRNSLRQRSDVKIKSAGTREEKITEYIQQIGNPYCYLDGKTVVKLSFSDTELALEDCMHGYLGGL